MIFSLSTQLCTHHPKRKPIGYSRGPSSPPALGDLSSTFCLCLARLSSSVCCPTRTCDVCGVHSPWPLLSPGQQVPFWAGLGPLACRSKQFSGLEVLIGHASSSLNSCLPMSALGGLGKVCTLDSVDKGGKAQVGPARGFGCNLHGAIGPGSCGREGAQPTAAVTHEHQCALDHLVVFEKHNLLILNIPGAFLRETCAHGPQSSFVGCHLSSYGRTLSPLSSQGWVRSSPPGPWAS